MICRRLRNIHASKISACSLITASDTKKLSTGYLIHPAVLDNAFQLGAVIEEDTVNKDETYVPAGIEAYVVAQVGNQSDSLLALSQAKTQDIDGTVRDHQIIDQDGITLMSLSGLLAKPLTSQASRKPVKRLEKHSIVYSVQRQVDGSYVNDNASRSRIQAKYARDNFSSHASGVLCLLQGSSSAGAKAVSMNSISDAGFSGLQSMGDWGLLRSVAAEMPNVECGGYVFDANIPNALRPSLGVASEQVGLPDGYGSKVSSGSIEKAILLHDTQAQPPAEYHLMPRPRGAFSNLVPEVVEFNESSEGTVQIEIKSVGINFRDVLNVLGMYPGDPGDPGGDCAGIVRSMPDTGSHLELGQSVFGLAAGSLGSHVQASDKTLVPMPIGLTFEEAATMPTVFITVDTALKNIAKLSKGESVLIHAAAGGVGLAAIQMAASIGANAVATAGSSNKRSLVRSLGVKCAMGSRDTIFASEIPVVGPIHVLLNSLTSSGMVSASLATMDLGGRMIEISKRDIWNTQRVSQERPDISYSLLAVDFMPEDALHAALARVSAGAAKSELRPLPFVSHKIGNVSAALRQMSQARHVGKIVVSSPSLRQREDINSQNAIAITGGLGTLGLQVANWLVTQQVANLMLLGRSGRSNNEIDISLETSPIYHCLCTSIGCNTAMSDDTSMVFSDQKDYKLMAILHAGGVLKDATLNAQSNKTVSVVFASKVDTVRRIISNSFAHSISLQMMFSSVAALLGSPGQANYCAANAILDEMSSQIQHMGSVSSSVQWGAWAGAGMAANDASTQIRVERTGMGLLEPAQGMRVVEGIVYSKYPLAICSANIFVWNTMMKRMGASPQHFFSNFVQKEVEGKTKVERVAGGMVRSIEAIETEVMDAIMSITGVEVGVDESLMNAGLDSLGAVELKNALETRVGLQLPGTLVFDYPTASALSTFIASQMPKDDIQVSDEFAPDSFANDLPVTSRGVSSSPLVLLAAASKTPASIHTIEIHDGISTIPFQRWDVEYISRHYAPARFGGYLSNIEEFDVEAFGFSMTEALLVDAQQRILLELSKEVRIVYMIFLLLSNTHIVACCRLSTHR